MQLYYKYKHHKVYNKKKKALHCYLRARKGTSRPKSLRRPFSQSGYKNEKNKTEHCVLRGQECNLHLTASLKPGTKSLFPCSFFRNVLL